MNFEATQNDYYEALVKRLDTELPKNLIFVEIGTASGTTAIRAIKALGQNASHRWLFTIDPYGDKPYVVGEQKNLQTYGYSDKTYREAMKDIKVHAYDREVNHTHWHMRSQDFIRVFHQIEFWSEGEQRKPIYGLAFLDGEHAWEPVLDEFRWFYHQMPKGAVIAIDDYNLCGTEQQVRDELSGLSGEWFFNTSDNHFRAYFTKS